MVKNKNKEIISIIVIYIVMFLFLTQSFGFKKDAGLFPRILSIGILILNTIQLIKVMTGKILERKRRDEIEPKKLLIILSASIVYILALQILGFLISSLIYLAVSMYFLRVKNKKLLLLVSIATVVIIYISFGTLLNVPIPKGILGF